MSMHTTTVPAHTRARQLAIVLALCLCALAACSSGGDSGGADGGGDGNGSTAEGSGPCPAEGDESPAKALLRCGATSVVLVETPYASGTGIVVRPDGDQTYVVTNLHVVDPFDAAAITLADGDLLGELPLVGAQAATDIAVLGPVDDAAGLTAVPLEPAPVDKGDDVFIVGYPGTIESPDGVDLTVTSGLVSRERDLPEWDQTYVQTDAVVEAGQSGGPMFAADGSLVGITALAFDESFSLALDTADVASSVDAVLAGEGDELVTVPPSADGEPEGGATQGTIELPVDLEAPVLSLPASSKDRTWNLSVTGPGSRFSVAVYDAFEGTLLAQNATGVALTEELLAAEAALVGASVEQYAGPAEPLSDEAVAAEVAPNTFRIEVPAGVPAEVELNVAPDAVPTTLSWTSDLQLWPLTPPVTVESLTVDEPAELILSSYQLGASFDLALDEGQSVQVLASSPWSDVDVAIGDPGVQLSGPLLLSGAEADGVTLLFDSESGLYGLDVDEPFTAPATGVYRVVLGNIDAVTTAARIEIRTD